MTRGVPTKSAVRAQLLAARRGRPDAEIAAARAAVVDVVLARWSSSWTWVAGYEPMRTEPGSIDLLAALRGRGARVIVPIVLDDRDLDWREWPDGRGGLGVDAVSAAALVLVPALAVDGAGTRLGRGGGSYDRALRRVGPEATVAALLYDGERVESVLPADPWDVPVAAVAAPSGWWSVPHSRPRVDGE